MGHAPDSLRRVPPEDGEGLRACMVAYQEGRIEGFDGLHAALAPRLGRYLSVLCRDRERVPDLVQEAFLQMHRSRHTYDRTQPLLPWAFAIARHVHLMDLRTRRRRPAAARETPEDVEALFPVQAEAGRLPEQDLIRDALHHLGGERREAVLLHHVWGFSFREIAGVLGISAAAAKLRSSRGMADLRGLIGRGGER